MPKINDLTNRPGGPQPTDEFWLASAGAAADFKSTIAALKAMIMSNAEDFVTNAVSWTPTVIGSTYDGLSLAGQYVKIGSLVTMIVTHQWTSRSGSGRLQYTFPAGIEPSGSQPLVPSLMRGVSYPASLVGVPFMATAGGFYNTNGGTEAVLNADALASGGGRITWRGTFFI